MLGDRIRSTVDQAATQMKSSSERPPFHEQMSPREAFAWWSKHRYDRFGQQVLQCWAPLLVAQLDAWLAHAQQALIPEATQPAAHPFPIGTPEGVIGPAMSQERRLEGGPLGPSVS